MREWYEAIPETHGEALLTYMHPSRRDWGYVEFARRVPGKDGIKNGEETDLDCGGPTCDPCPWVR
jgi:hypothetical protein